METAVGCDTREVHPKQGPSEKTGTGEGRRASLVIKETQDLLDSLHADAERSRALMDELEALLLASQSASREPPSNTHARMNTGYSTLETAHFVAVQPLDALSADEDDQSQVSRPLSTAVSTRRYSSTIIMDGSMLYAENSSAAGVNGQPSSAAAPGDTALPAPLAPSLARIRASLRGKSWTEGRSTAHSSVRRRTIADATYGGAPCVPRGFRRGNSGSRGNFATAIAATRASCELPPASLRAPSTSSGVAVPGMAWASLPGGTAPWLWDRGSATEDGDGGLRSELEGKDSRDAAPAMAAASDISVGGERTGRPASRARGGRFIKMLSGIFDNSTEPDTSTAKALVGAVLPTSSTQPLSPTGSGLDHSFPPSAGLLLARRSDSSQSIGGSRPLTPTPPLRGSSFRGVASPLTMSAQVPASLPTGTAALPTRSLSAATSFLDIRVAGPSGLHVPQLVPAGIGGPFAALGSKVSSRRSVECTFPQI